MFLIFLLTFFFRCFIFNFILLIFIFRFLYFQRFVEVFFRNVVLVIVLIVGRKYYSRVGFFGYLRTFWGLSWGERGQAYFWEIIGVLVRLIVSLVFFKWIVIGFFFVIWQLFQYSVSRLVRIYQFGYLLVFFLILEVIRWFLYVFWFFSWLVFFYRLRVLICEFSGWRFLIQGQWEQIQLLFLQIL